jgi:hypothetical protein
MQMVDCLKVSTLIVPSFVWPLLQSLTLCLSVCCLAPVGIIPNLASQIAPSNLPSSTVNMADASVYATRSSQRRQKQALEEEQKKQRRLARKGLPTNATKSADQGDREAQENGRSGSANEGNDKEPPDDEDEEEEEDEEEIDEYATDILPTSMVQTSTPKSGSVLLKQLVTEEPLERKSKSPPLPRRRQALFDEYEDDYEDDEEKDQNEQQQQGRATPFKRRRGRYYRLGMRSLSTSWRSLTTSTRNTFSKMVYKGVGISLVKPIGGNWKSFGIGMKIPITNHFPLYDSNICLPRLIAFVGVNYPLSYKISFTLSVPIQAVQIYLLVLSQANPDQWPQVKATDNVKRLGLTWSLKIPAKFPTNKIWYQALTSSWSPAFNFVPGSKLVQAILPFLLFTPTLLVAMILYLLSLSQETARLLSNLFVRRKGECHQDQSQSSLHSIATPSYVSSYYDRSASNTPISATRLYSHSNKDNDMVVDPVLRGKQGQSTSTWQLENSMMTRFENATQMIQQWMSQRSTALGSALGYSNRMHTLSVNMDFQPFYLLFLRQFVMTALILADQVLFACLDTFFYAIFALNQRMIQWRKRGGLFAKQASQSSSSSGMNEINPTSMSYERVGSFTPSADSMVNPREFASRLKAKQQQRQRQDNSQWRGGNSQDNSKSSVRNLSQPSGLLARVSVSSSRVSNRSGDRGQNDSSKLG